jgi:hypothetical protein
MGGITNPDKGQDMAKRQACADRCFRPNPGRIAAAHDKWLHGTPKAQFQPSYPEHPLARKAKTGAAALFLAAALPYPAAPKNTAAIWIIEYTCLTGAYPFFWRQQFHFRRCL